MAKGNILIGQSGGPTSVINSSLAGVIDTAAGSGLAEFTECITALRDSCRNGYSTSAQPKSVLEGLRRTPSSALGSSRHKVQESDLPRILSVMENTISGISSLSEK